MLEGNDNIDGNEDSDGFDKRKTVSEGAFEVEGKTDSVSGMEGEIESEGKVDKANKIEG